MAYLDALEEQRRQTALRNYLITALLLIVVICLVGWQARQNEITVHVRPGLTQEVSVKANEMPAENVFNFALTLMMQIYRWREDGRTEYPANVNGLYVYMTEQCQLNLLADAEQRDKSGELGERTRVWEPMAGSYFSPERVKVIDDRTWLVTIDAELRESVRAQTVKEGFFRYEIYVQATGSDRDVNPYGLQLNCFAPNSPSKLDPTPTPVVTSP